MYSQNLSRNISTGLAEKRRAMGDPGGQPPLGFRRQDCLLVVDPTTMASVTRAFDLSAAGQPDHEVADALGLTVHTVRHVLTNPVYLGQLTDGSPLRLGPTVEVSTWNLVQARREDRRTRVPDTTPRRCYALKLVCLDCRTPLHGHGGRYRHAGSACAGFTASRPDMAPAQGRHASTAGTSYPREWYESIVEHLLGRLAVTDERAIRRVVTELAADKTSPIDQFALARIARARHEALRRLEQSRDVASWQATVTRLDAEEAAVRTEVRGPSVIPEATIRAYLANLGEVWATADDSSRQAIALALFDRLAVSGFRVLEYAWSATARSYGLDRLVPEELTIDLPALGLRAGPLGTFVVRSEARAQGADLAVSA